MEIELRKYAWKFKNIKTEGENKLCYEDFEALFLDMAIGEKL